MPRLHLSCGQLLADRGKSKKCDFCFFKYYFQKFKAVLPRSCTSVYTLVDKTAPSSSGGRLLANGEQARGGHAIIKMPRLHLSCGQLLADRGKSKKCDFCFFRIFLGDREFVFTPRGGARGRGQCMLGRAGVPSFLAFPLGEGGGGADGRGTLAFFPVIRRSKATKDLKLKAEGREVIRQTEARSAQARRQGHRKKDIKNSECCKIFFGE